MKEKPNLSLSLILITPYAQRYNNFLWKIGGTKAYGLCGC